MEICEAGGSAAATGVAGMEGRDCLASVFAVDGPAPASTLRGESK